MTTALGVLTGLVVVPEAAGAAAHGSTAATRELVAGEVVGSPQLVSLTRTIGCCDVVGSGQDNADQRQRGSRREQGKQPMSKRGALLC
jgi:hypothetical protein